MAYLDWHSHRQLVRLVDAKAPRGWLRRAAGMATDRIGPWFRCRGGGLSSDRAAGRAGARRLRERIDALGPAPRAELLHVLMLPDFERADRIGEFWSLEPEAALDSCKTNTSTSRWWRHPHSQ